MRIAIIIGSTRPGRAGDGVGRWVSEQARRRDDAEYSLVDLEDYDLPLLSEPTVPGAANREYDVPQTRRWSETIDSFDGFVFVTPEYNHGVPAALKNAFDVIYPEWSHKAVGFVSYGADAGIRAVEQWRQIVANAQLVAVRAQVSMSLFTDFGDDGFAPQDRRAGELSTLFDQVVQMSTVLVPLRET